MSVTSSQLRDLINLGLGSETLLAVVTIFDRDASRSVTTQTQSKEAIRAKRYRNNRKQIQLLAEANDAAEQRDESVTVRRDESVTSAYLSSSLLPLNSSLGSKKRSSEPRARGVRLSPDTELSEAGRQFAIEHGVNPDAAWAEFVDYWVGIPGQRGCKTADRGWPATWRNRVRAISKNGKPHAKPPSAIMGAVDEHIRNLERRRDSEVRQTSPRLLSHG